MAKTFEDIGKDAVEFITRGFPNSGTFKVIAETKTPNGVSVKATGTRSFDFKDKDTIEEKLSGEVEPKYRFDDIEVSSKLSTVGEFETGVSFENVATKGAKVSFAGVQSDKDGNALKGSAAYKNDQVSVKAGVKFPFKVATHSNWNGELTYRHDRLYAGAELKYDLAIRGGPEVLEKDQPKDRSLWNLRGGYIAADQQFVLSVENQFNKDKKTTAQVPVLNLLNINYLYAITAALRFGFGASVERHNAKGTEFHAATEYKADTDSVFMGKVSVVNAPVPDDREFRLALALKQNLSERVNVTVGADINARALLGTPGKATLGTTKPHSYGFELKFQ
jgi:hypothetical protein